MTEPVRGGSFFTNGATTKDGKPFVITQYEDTEGNVIAQGQLTPAQAISGGLRQIQAAIEAERDAGMLAYLTEMGMEKEAIAALISGMRDHRQQYDPPHGRPE